MYKIKYQSSSDKILWKTKNTWLLQFDYNIKCKWQIRLKYCNKLIKRKVGVLPQRQNPAIFFIFCPYLNFIVNSCFFSVFFFSDRHYSMSSLDSPFQELSYSKSFGNFTKNIGILLKYWVLLQLIVLTQKICFQYLV